MENRSSERESLESRTTAPTSVTATSTQSAVGCPLKLLFLHTAVNAPSVVRVCQGGKVRPRLSLIESNFRDGRHQVLVGTDILLVVKEHRAYIRLQIRERVVLREPEQ